MTASLLLYALALVLTLHGQTIDLEREILLSTKAADILASEDRLWITQM